MALEDEVQPAVEKLLERARQHTEGEVRAFVTELLTAAAKELATARLDDRRVADSARRKAVREESGRVRAEVEKTWAAKLSEVHRAADGRSESDLRKTKEDAEREQSQKVASVRAEGQKVLAAALEAARLEADRTLESRLEQMRKEAERTVATELAAASVPQPQSDDVLGRVLEGIRQLDQAARLTDALDTLVELAADEVPRAAVLTVEADRLHGWKFVGFGPTLDEARQVDLKMGDAGIVGRVVETGDACSVVCGPDGVPEDEPAFTTLSTGVQALAVPVRVGGQVMAVVYGDDTDRRPAAAWRASLEVLARYAGHCLEALTAARATQLALQDIESLVSEDAGPTLPFDEAGDEAGDERQTPGA